LAAKDNYTVAARTGQLPGGYQMLCNDTPNASNYGEGGSRISSRIEEVTGILGSEGE
jgi:hypothetical protein